MGHQLILNPDLSTRYLGYPTWTLSFPLDEEIQSIIPATRGPVASVGRVLGNRSTLYKYLNPHLTAVTTATSTAAPSSSFGARPGHGVCGLYLVDAVKGTVVYHAVLPSSGGACDVQATITENWLVYSYFEEDFNGMGQSKGNRVVSVEFYEGVKADDKIKRYGVFVLLLLLPSELVGSLILENWRTQLGYVVVLAKDHGGYGLRTIIRHPIWHHSTHHHIHEIRGHS